MNHLLLYIFSTIIAGLVAGIPRGLWLMFMEHQKFTSLDTISYLGCLVRKKIDKTTFILGVIFHFCLSTSIAFFYTAGFEIIGSIAVFWGIVFSLVHWVIALAIALPIMDTHNYCVKKKLMKPMGFFVQPYGKRSMLIFLTAHLIYGVTLTVAYKFLQIYLKSW